MGCINPTHLRWASRSDNNLDQIGHGTAVLGESSHLAKLTNADVTEIMEMRGTASLASIGARFGVAPSTIYSIFVGKSWSWLTGIKR